MRRLSHLSDDRLVNLCLDGVATPGELLHLDDCDESNGPLRVIPGSHGQGILSSEQIARHRQETAEVVCTVPAGGALVMAPLLLHASSRARSPSHRRVLHLEFAPLGLLPEGLAWAV